VKVADRGMVDFTSPFLWFTDCDNLYCNCTCWQETADSIRVWTLRLPFNDFFSLSAAPQKIFLPRCGPYRGILLTIDTSHGHGGLMGRLVDLMVNGGVLAPRV